MNTVANIDALLEQLDIPPFLRWDTAACAETDPELFFPERGESSFEARNVCADCPLRQPCLEYALAHKEYGVWGGTSERQRQRLRRQRRQATCAGEVA